MVTYVAFRNKHIRFSFWILAVNSFVVYVEPGQCVRCLQCRSSLLGELMALPKSLSWIEGPLPDGGKGKEGWEEESDRRDGRKHPWESVYGYGLGVMRAFW